MTEIMTVYRTSATSSPVNLPSSFPRVFIWDLTAFLASVAWHVLPLVYFVLAQTCNSKQ